MAGLDSIFKLHDEMSVEEEIDFSRADSYTD